jgi:penicillin-binding protein 1A
MITERQNIDISNLDLDCATIIYANDKQGNPYEIYRLHGAENRTWVDLENISQYAPNAAIAVEDQRFMHHKGVDFKRTATAFLNSFLHIFGGTQGGSTITQQLVKNITGDKQIRASRKVREIISALCLEKRHTKQEILEAYLNVVYFGNNINGIEAAANFYFDKPAKDLTLQETVAIIAITKHPVRYDPFVHPENNKARRQHILKKMLEFNFIKPADYNKAAAGELKLTEKKNHRKDSVTSYFIDHLIESVIAGLVEQYGFTRQYATKQIFRGGYRIYSTVDERVQHLLEEKLANPVDLSHVRGGQGELQASMVILAPNGAIQGLVGGVGEKKISRGLNRATLTKRQPGSTIKPVAVYALAMENNLVHYSSLVEDQPIKLGNKVWPANAYGRYYGNILLPKALEESSNAVAVRTCQKLTPQKSFAFLKNNLGLDSLVESKTVKGKIYNDKNLASMALGAVTDGVSLLELTGAYQIFCNGGYFAKPYCYTKVVDRRGNAVLEQATKPQQVITKSTAIVMNHLLRNVVTAGTGRTANFKQLPIFGKTGTTSEEKDAWFVGATPYFLCGVWVGYDRPATMLQLWPHYPPTHLWRTVMEPLHKNLQPKEFIEDPDVLVCPYCNRTGLLAGQHCKAVSHGFYSKSKLPPRCSALHIQDNEPEPPTNAIPPAEPTNEQQSTPAAVTATNTAAAAPIQVTPTPASNNQQLPTAEPVA